MENRSRSKITGADNSQCREGTGSRPPFELGASGAFAASKGAFTGCPLLWACRAPALKGGGPCNLAPCAVILGGGCQRESWERSPKA